MTWEIPYDTTVFVTSSIHKVVSTLLEAFALVAIVVFVFLGKLRATVVPIVAVPVALIGTFAVMLAIGFSANTISLLALVLAIGIVVDDAIVAVEAVEHMMAEHPEMSPADATKAAMGQITGPIIAITLVLLSVFVPVAFIPGIVGQLYQQFAVAVSVSMLISAVNALTLSPAFARCCCAMVRRPAGSSARCRAASTHMQRSYAGVVRSAGAADAADFGTDRGRGRPDRLVWPRRPLGLSARGGSGRLSDRGAVARGRLAQPHRPSRGRCRADRQGDARVLRR